LNKNDSYKVLKRKIQKIREILKECDPEESYLHGWMNHEMLFSNEVLLKKHLLGIVCYNCDEEKYEEMKKLSKKYGDILLIQDDRYFPQQDFIL
ncbi:unnamed protein product, partial [marine sediment metagenome]